MIAPYRASDPHGAGIRRLHAPECHALISPLVYAVPVQLLAYCTAFDKGTDVDQPRNWRKALPWISPKHQQVAMKTECLYLKSDGSKSLLVKELTAPEDGDRLFHNGCSYVVRHVFGGKKDQELKRFVIATEIVE